jgi:crotonobetaine/carnitine-CoA ligase
MGLPGLEERTVLATLERALQRSPDDVAQIDRGVRPDAVHTWLGLALVGGIQVPVNTAYKGGFLSHVLRDSRAEVLVVEAHYVERVLAVADEVPALHTLVVLGEAEVATTRFTVLPWGELATASPADPVRRGPGDLMAIMYTSGTTGRAKGVLIPHAQAYTYASREHLERPHHGDRSLVTLPIFHLAGQWYGVYQALIHTIPCVLEPGFSVSAFWAAVREYGITYTTLLGAMAELLAQRPPQPDDADNPLELAVMAPLATDVAAFRRRFDIDVAPATIVGGECGFPRDGFDLRLVDDAGDDVRPGEIGELLVRPALPHTVMAGYQGLPEVTARTIVDGWVHTGDAFRTDADGRFFFSDRMKDALRRRGENVSSFEVESVVNSHPDVYENAVVAVPSQVGEDEIKVVVVPQEGATIDPEALTWYLVDRLPYFMVPRYVELADALPKTPTHKVQKALLRESGPAGWDREAAGIRLRRTGDAAQRSSPRRDGVTS